MKNCNRWMVVCLVGALAVIFVLPRLGIEVAGASSLFILLMIGCCVLPIFFMMFAASKNGGKGGCCGSSESKESTKELDSSQGKPAEKPACH